LGAERDPHPPVCPVDNPVDNFIVKRWAVYIIGRKLNNNVDSTGQTTGATRTTGRPTRQGATVRP
jgi:hypothetical protein